MSEGHEDPPGSAADGGGKHFGTEPEPSSKPVSRGRRLLIWSVVTVLLLGLAAVQFLSGSSFESSLFRLLPQEDRDPSVELSRQFFQRRLARDLFVLVGHPDPDEATAGAREVRSFLTRSGQLTSSAVASPTETAESFYQLYFPYRDRVLAPDVRSRLSSERGVVELLRENEERLYSPMSSAFAWSLTKDPILLFPRFLDSLPGPPGDLRWEDGELRIVAPDRTYVLVRGTLQFDPDDRTRTFQFSSDHGSLRQTLEERDAGYRVLASGWVLHAIEGRRAAETDVRRLTLFSVIGVATLCLFVSFSVGSLFHLFMPILFGLLLALTTTRLVFGEIHLLTLGFGTSLVGISVDYVFHFLCARGNSPHDRLVRVRPAITVGLITTCLGYLGLATSPLPGLVQMAFFSGVGLLGAYLVVVFASPLLPVARRTPALPFGGAEGLAHRIARVPTWFVIVFAAMSVSGFVAFLPRISTSDDVRQFQKPSERLLEQDAEVRTLLGAVTTPSSFLLVQGNDPQEVLEREEALQASLPEGSLLGTSSFVPSLRRQEANLALLDERFSTRGSPEFRDYLDRLEFEPEVLHDWAAYRKESEDRFLTFEQWWASPVSRDLRFLWLDRSPGGSRAIVLPKGNVSPGALDRAATSAPGVQHIRPVEDLNRVLQVARTSFAETVVLAYLAVAVLAFLRYGLSVGFRILLTPLLAAVGTLFILQLLDEPITLFHEVGLLLVLGIGVDYAVFFAEEESVESGTVNAILLSAATTLLSFGVLSLSELPVLRGIGWSVVIGITLSLVLSPLAARPWRSPLRSRRGLMGALFGVVLFGSGCAPSAPIYDPPNGNALRLDRNLDPAVAASMDISIELQRDELLWNLEGVLEVERDRVALVAFTPVGTTLFSAVFQDGELTIEKLPLVRLPVPPETILLLVHVGLWPLDSVRGWLVETSASLTLEEDVTRKVGRRGETFVVVSGDESLVRGKFGTGRCQIEAPPFQIGITIRNSFSLDELADP